MEHNTCMPKVGNRWKWLLWTWLLAPLLLFSMPAQASSPPPQTQPQTQPCTYHVHSTSAARASGDVNVRPTEGWVTVELPEFWNRRWPEHSGSVWYRIDWERRCPSAESASHEPTVIGFKRILMAAEIFINEERLWRDASLSDPITHGWNTPRWWLLPESAVHPGVNTVWVRVVGPVELTPGIDAMQIGPIDEIREEFDRLTWRRHTTFLISNAMSAALGCVFLAIWIRRRKEHIYGWFAVMSCAWSLFLSTLLATAPWSVWPILVEGTTTFESSLRMARLNIVAMLLYIASFCLFSLRFSEQRLPKIERLLWLTIGLAAISVTFAPRSAQPLISFAANVLSALIFFCVCVQVLVHKWRKKGEGRWAITLCWGSFLVVMLHDFLFSMRILNEDEAWVPFAVLTTTALIALMLGGRFAASTRKIEQFNVELEQHVNDARHKLAHALEREHTQKLEHMRLQERVQLAHDLHDSLGSSLVRSIAIVERSQRSQQPLAHERMLSLLKILRDDLRQMIDYGSNAGATLPATPEQWLAPLRYRFVRIFDELNITWEWHCDTEWRSESERPSAVQCLSLSRLLEEALTNVIKHSRATHVSVCCSQSDDHSLVLQVQDNGVGFDVSAAQESVGLGIGMRSMASRARRVGAQLSMESAPHQGCTIRVELPLQ